MLKVSNETSDIKLYCAGDCSHDRRYRHFIKSEYEKKVDVTIIEKQKIHKAPEVIDIEYDDDGNLIKEIFSEQEEIEVDVPIDNAKILSLYQIVECGGCGFISYRLVITYLTDYQKFTHTGTYKSRNEDGEIVGTPITIENERPQRIEILFPKRGQEVWVKKRYDNIPIEVDDIYSEVVQSFNEGLHIIGTTGLRTLIEAICNQLKIKGGFVRDSDGIIVKHKKEVIEGGVLKYQIGDDVYSTDIAGKIFGLAEKGFISYIEASWIDVHRKLGNKSAHQGKAPPPSIIKSMIKIAEHFLNKLYQSSKTDEIEREFEGVRDFINKPKK